MDEQVVSSARVGGPGHGPGQDNVLDDEFKSLAQRNRLAIEEVEVQVVAQVGCGFQKAVKLTLDHLVFLLWHLQQEDGVLAEPGCCRLHFLIEE